MGRPLTPGLLATGASAALAFPLGYATIGLVLGLRRPANPIGWLYATSGLVWALIIPFEPWLNSLIVDHQPLALAGQLAVVFRETGWAPAIALGITLPFLLLPDGRLRSRRWRLVVADTVVGVTLLVLGGSLAPGQLTNGPIPIDKPFGLPGVAGKIAAAAVVPGLVLYALSLPAAPAAELFEDRLPHGNFDVVEFAWIGTPFAASANRDIHVTEGGGNFGGFADPMSNALFDRATAKLDPARAAALANQIDRRLWEGLPSIPLSQRPTFIAWRDTLRNVVDNPSIEGPLWNAEAWGYAKN